MMILVTGATGFIGAALCRALVERGDSVIAFHRYNSSIKCIADLPIKRVIGDLTDDASIHNALQQYPDAVIHLGARHVATRSPDPLLAVNVAGTRTLLEESFRAGVRRVVLMSTAATLGCTTERTLEGRIIPLPETHAAVLDPREEPYTASKKLAEVEAQWALAYGLDVVTTHAGTVIGPGDHYRKRLNFITRYIKNTPKVRFDGGLNFVDVRDVVTGLIHAVNYGERGGRYLLTGTNIDFDTLFQKLSDLTGVAGPTLKVDPARINDLFRFKQNARNLFPVGGSDTDLTRLAGKYYYYDNSASRLALKLAPPRPLDSTLRDTYAYLTGETA